jgi:S-adenosylmethionine hydrolase
LTRVITLTTDFGTRDSYVGTMKGVIYGIAPDVHVVDITHDIEKQDIVEASIVLKSTRSFFPDGTIHVCVVDPEVGGERRPILAESGGYYFIGPDNGVFSFALDRDFRAWELSNPDYHLPLVSDTFHGRDVFSPVAAHLALGVDPEELGSRVETITRSELRRPLIFQDRIQAEVIHVDSFGNLITNVTREVAEGVSEGRRLRIEVSGRIVEGIHRTYAEGATGQLIAVLGSTDLLEIAVRDGSASRRLGVGRGDPVRLTWRS